MFGDTEQFFGSQTFIASASLIKGDTAFLPPDIEYRLTLAFNVNYAWAQEERFLDADPLDGHTRTDYFARRPGSLRRLSYPQRLRPLRLRLDPGRHPAVQLDFRGFLFQDQQLGVRLFGNRDNNLYQYNLAAIWRLEKDTNSGLNDLVQDIRRTTSSSPTCTGRTSRSSA